MQPVGLEDKIQRKWDELVCQKAAFQLRGGANCGTTTGLRALCSTSSGAWLNAIPSASLGLNLDDNALRVAVGLRLGIPLVLPHHCICGMEVTKLGHHGLECKRSTGRHLRHNLLNDTIRALQSANIPAVREPPGLSRVDSKRPDGAMLVL